MVFARDYSNPEKDYFAGYYMGRYEDSDDGKIWFWATGCIQRTSINDIDDWDNLLRRREKQILHERATSREQEQYSKEQSYKTGYNVGFDDAVSSQKSKSQSIYDNGYSDGKLSERHQSQKAYEQGFADGQKNVLEQSAEKVKQEYFRGYNMALKTAQETVTQDYDLGFQHGCKLAFGIGSTRNARVFALIDDIRTQLLKENQSAHVSHLDQVCKGIHARNRDKFTCISTIRPVRACETYVCSAATASSPSTPLSHNFS